MKGKKPTKAARFTRCHNLCNDRFSEVGVVVSVFIPQLLAGLSLYMSVASPVPRPERPTMAGNMQIQQR